MPVRDSLYTRNLPDEADLRAELISELRAPNESGEPVIVIERSRPSSIHLFAVWSRFEEVEQYVRSRVLLDAFKEAKGEDEALKVTVSMGLTPVEAQRMGIE